MGRRGGGGEWGGGWSGGSKGLFVFRNQRIFDTVKT